MKDLKEKANQKILLIGATGTIGKPLLSALSSLGQSIRAGTRTPAQKLGENIETVFYDYDQTDCFDAALEGVDRIFYLTRAADVKAEEVARPLFEKARAAGVRHIVNMSALGVDADDSIDLRKVELTLQASGVPCTLIRPNWFMQNFSTGNYGDMIRAQGALYLPAGDAKVSFIDARDIADVAAHILTHEGHAGKEYNLTGTEALSFAQVTEVLGAAAMKSIGYTAISDEDLAAALKAQGMPTFVIDFMTMLFSAVRAGYNTTSTSNVQDILGREPRTFAAFAQEVGKTL